MVRRSSAWVCFDGKQRQELLCGDSVRVRMSPNPVPTIDHLEQTSDWFDSLEVGLPVVRPPTGVPRRGAMRHRMPAGRCTLEGVHASRGSDMLTPSCVAKLL